MKEGEGIGWYLHVSIFFFFPFFSLNHSLTCRLTVTSGREKIHPQKIRMTWVVMGPGLEKEPGKGIT
jgi:hypothetical protein